MPKSTSKILWILKRFFLIGFIIFGLIGAFVYSYFLEDLPDYKSLDQYNPPIVTRLYSEDGHVFAEYAQEKRIFVSIHDIPPLVINAFVAGEDKTFYEHKGLDYMGIMRALLTNIQTHLSGRKSLAGGSTITQQVAKNFLLSHERTLTRKIKEALLAFRIEKSFSKRKILELYLNQIYLGNQAYGVASAAIQYFNKNLDQLSLEEIAYLAALPKAPNLYNIQRNSKAALARRNWVIGRMASENFISNQQAQEAISKPLIYNFHQPAVQADHCAELIRQQLYKNYGSDSLYKGGLTVKTTLNSKLQRIARESLRQGLVDQDRRMGWRGPINRVDVGQWQKELEKIKIPLGVESWQLAVVLKVTPREAFVGLKKGLKGSIPFEYMKWAHRFIPAWGESKYPTTGLSPQSPFNVVKVGDVIVVHHKQGSIYSLEQIPEVNGALIAMDPYTGRILALEGGFSFARSQFNWVTQAKRQPGSAFKAFIYLAALEKGFLPTSLLEDNPIEMDLGPTLGAWKPENIMGKTFGTVTLRTALEESLNLAPIWLTMQMGLRPIQDIGCKFGIYDKVPPELAVVLGTLETTLLRLTRAYAMLANGGYPINPTFIDRIQDRNGRTLFRSTSVYPQELWQGQLEPTFPEGSNQQQPLASPLAIYQLLSILQGGVENGAAKNAKIPGYVVSGKTGTTNNYLDAWFIGTTPTLAVGVVVGFDKPRSLGRYQTGGRVAAPIFASFMKKALPLLPNFPYQFPEDGQLVWVDRATGHPSVPNGPNSVLEVLNNT